MSAKKHVVVVGGGFGGVKAAELLSQRDNITVTLVSDRPDFWYFPTMYRTATGTTDELSAIPLQRLFEGRNVTIVIDEATRIDRTKQELTLKSGKKLAYDDIILSLGVITNYFGIKGLPEYSYGVKSIAEATKLKRHLHLQLIRDEKPDLHYVVVGGGPTGIEVAGQLKKFLGHVMTSHKLPKRAVHVDLVEAAPRLLPRMHPSVGRVVAHRLRQLGVRLHLGATVKGETADSLQLEGKTLESQTVIWTAGQANDPFFAANKFDLSEHHKVVVDDYLQASDHVYVIGDNAETTYSGLAQTAIYDAEFVSADIERRYSGKPRKVYKPKKPIYVIPAGEQWAFVEWGRFRFHGLVGWLLREAGDVRGFLDIERPVDAGEQWLKGFDSDYDCALCD